MKPVEVRARLAEVLRLDLVGPGPADVALAGELLPMDPRLYYLTGFLVPRGAPVDVREDPDADDDLDAGGDDGNDGHDGAPPRRAFLPSSIGASVIVPATVSTIDVVATWGEYASETAAPDSRQLALEKKKRRVRPHWRRTPKEHHATLTLPERGTCEQQIAEGVKIVAIVRPISAAANLDHPGARAVAVFVLNERVTEDRPQSSTFLFQAALDLRVADGFIARRNSRGRTTNDENDERIAELQFRQVFEYAVGHGASVDCVIEGERCALVRTTWTPSAEVEKVVPSRVTDDLKLGMETLASATSFDVLRAMLEPLPREYDTWIAKQAQTQVDPHQESVRDTLITDARAIRARIVEGIALLADDGVRLAFTLANRAMARAQRQRRPNDAPTWHPFQLAFLLMNVCAISKGDHVDRDRVDLLFFPTGGGKTEAYLGLSAFTLILRRLRHPGVTGAGVTVIMRYTLRLLTLDQLERATQLICALELERRERARDGDVSLGTWPFEVGLWVGGDVTPNRMRSTGYNPDTAEERVKQFDKHSDIDRPVPVEHCPWCSVGGARSDVRFFAVPEAAPTQLIVRCTNRDCPFSAASGLPAVFVDDSIYQRLPCFLIATVDKFAALPWEGRAGALFGRVDRHDSAGFYGPCNPGVGRPIGDAGGLPPPDLIIQDELHLISGPLGTMVGLYEMAIDLLAGGDRAKGPKIVASTATVRRAQTQIQALFGRNKSAIFPPPGPDRHDSFFAHTVRATEKNARRYLGVAAPGRSLKVVMLRVSLALLTAAQKMYEASPSGPRANNPADAYMTLLGYFNSLRELGGTRRIIEDEVKRDAPVYGTRGRVGAYGADFAKRSIAEPVELTSRETTAKVSEAKARLALAMSTRRSKAALEPVDVALATSMISVGLDIQRLGLMVVLGQPKTTSEYIQTTSRVGRDDERPGLVVTLFNVHKPRDRSHYERFGAYHASFYRAVEASSVTPFAPRALDRGAAAVTVALTRLDLSALTPNEAAGTVDNAATRDRVGQIGVRLGERAKRASSGVGEGDDVARRVRARASNLIEKKWTPYVTGKNGERGALQYTPNPGTSPPMLHDPLDRRTATDPATRPWVVARRSLRDVEPSVDVYIASPDEEPSDDEEVS